MSYRVTIVNRMWISVWITYELVCKNIYIKILRSANESVYALNVIYYSITLAPVIM